MKPGDILLVRDYKEDLLGNLIMAGERSRYGNVDYARWTHSALIVTAEGDLIEANQGGIERSHISKYEGHETHIISPSTPFAYERALAVRFADAQVGTKYDVLDFVGLAVQCLFGWQISLHSDKRFICSGLVARATEKYIPCYPLPSEAMMPADLAAFWSAPSGDPLPPISAFGRFLDVLWQLFNPRKKDK